MDSNQSPGILVVGGGTGIGKHVTELLVKQHEARVVVLGLHIEEELRTLQQSVGESRLRLVEGDATESDRRHSIVSLAKGFLGQIDAFVCTMGTLGEIQRLENLNPQKLRDTYDVNLFAPILIVSASFVSAKPVQKRQMLNAARLSSCFRNFAAPMARSSSCPLP